jgi:hypothetical protein
MVVTLALVVEVYCPLEEVVVVELILHVREEAEEVVEHLQ